MPKFLYTIVFLIALSWWGLVNVLLNNAPNSTQIIFGVMVLILITLTLTFSVPLYFYFYKKASDFTNLRFLYRKAFKWSGVLSFTITGMLTLKAFGLATWWNGSLFLVLCAMIVLHLRKTR